MIIPKIIHSKIKSTNKNANAKANNIYGVDVNEESESLGRLALEKSELEAMLST